MRNLSILTFNAGLLRVSILGKTIAEPTAFIQERYAEMSRAILLLDADIVALQEVYFEEHRDGLVRALQPRYPYVSRIDRRPWPNLGNGMLLFSKLPMEGVEHRGFADVDIFERIFVRKGALFASIHAPELGTVRLAIVHTTAGGTVHTESVRANAARAKNLEETSHFLRASKADLRLLLGDFNAGPEASSENYEQILAAGFSDAAVGTPVDGQYTWDAQNPLNRGGPHSDCPSQRIDHVFIDQTSGVRTRTVSAELAFTQPVVNTITGAVTLSDHYGLFIELAYGSDSATPIVHHK